MVWPARSFRLKIEADLVGSYKCSLWWAVRVKTHVIKSVIATNSEYSLPTFYIHWGISGDREVAVLNCSAQHNLSVIEIKPFTSYLELTHTKLNLFYLFTSGCLNDSFQVI